MREVASALSEAGAVRARGGKVGALAAALKCVASTEPDRLPFAARLMTGAVLPSLDPRTLGVGYALVLDATTAVTGEKAGAIVQKARASGDLGTAVGETLALRETEPDGISLEAAEAMASAIADASAREAKVALLAGALGVATAMEGRYLVRAMLGEMRVGAKEGIVLDAIAKAFEKAPADVRRAAGLVADVGELARLAHEDRLGEAEVKLGRPLEFMLATPIETAKGADLAVPHAVEEKIDGIRAQAHVHAGTVRLFARGKGTVTAAFPDLVGPLEAASASGQLSDAILDGEIVVVASDGRPRPFSALQPRLKKAAPDAALMQEFPVKYLAYDLMFEAGETLLDRPFAERRARLERWAKDAPIVLHPSRPLASREAIDAEFDAARNGGFEGLVLKRLDAPYAAGVRGFAWLKVKKSLGSLDVVVVAVQRGHGRRAGVLSDYTFALWNLPPGAEGRALVTLGKAYSGLTDEEIRVMTEKFTSLATGPEEHGYLHVRPEVVIEVGFDGLQRSDRHASGFALRFPRILKLRDDKTPDEADSMEAVRALWDAQLASGHREDQTAKDRKAAGAATKTKGRRSGRRPDVRIAAKQLKLFDD